MRQCLCFSCSYSGLPSKFVKQRAVDVGRYGLGKDNGSKWCFRFLVGFCFVLSRLTVTLVGDPTSLSLALLWASGQGRGNKDFDNNIGYIRQHERDPFTVDVIRP